MRNKIIESNDADKQFLSAIEKTPKGVTVTNRQFVIVIDDSYLGMEAVKPLDAYQALHGEFMEIARVLSTQTDHAADVFPFFFDTFLKSLVPTGIGYVPANGKGVQNA